MNGMSIFPFTAYVAYFSNMKPALIKLHIAVFLWGFTGILGKAIELNEALLVWYRIAITVASLFALLKWKNELERLPFKTTLRLMGIGAIVALHWVCFYGSIKYANVSIALICFSATGALTAILEPLMTNKRMVLAEMLLGLLGIAGIYLIFHFDVRYRTGIAIGIVSTILCVVFSILNKKTLASIAPKTMMLYELLGGLLMLTLLMPVYLQYFPAVRLLPSGSDWLWLLLLSWVCTVYAMDLSLQALQKVSAFTLNLTLNLEPVYGIVLAFLLYHENNNLGNTFYIGFALIVIAVLLQMVRVIKLNKH